MLDASRAGELLKKTWSTPTEFARELFSVVTSKGPRTLESPLTISVAPGATALRVVRGAPKPDAAPAAAVRRKAAAARVAASTEQSRPPARPDEPRKPPTSSPSVPTAASAVGRVDELFTPKRPDQEITLAPRPVPREPSPVRDAGPVSEPPAAPDRHDGAQFTPSGGVVALRGPDPVPAPGDLNVAGLKEQPSLTQHQVYQGGDAPRREPPPKRLPPSDPRLFNDRHPHPVIEVEGPVSFSGREPVQFDEPPRLFNPKTKTYDPIVDYDLERGTHVPRGRLVYDPLVGKVKSGSGKSWVVTIYPEGKPPTSGDGSNPTSMYDVTVSVLNAPDAYKPRVGDWVGPILEKPSAAGKPDDDYYYFLGGDTGRYAKVKTLISAAAGSTLGVGTITLCSRNARALTADGADATCYNAGGSIAANKFIQVDVVDGDWATVVSPC